ncbi:MAG TPA: YciI family protein [Rickettsiales bacterium]|nr:YciI family protein [Rickettsiales bacterium]
MKQFVVIAHDGKDEKALERRMAARQTHIDGLNKLRAEGNVICGIALTDENEKMIGSMVATSFATRADFDKWLATEPYVVGNVWQDIQVFPGNLGPSFADLLKKKA